MSFAGISTVFGHKKWMFCYIVFFTITWLLTKDLIDSSQYMACLLALIPLTLGASSFDKSVWRKSEPTT